MPAPPVESATSAAPASRSCLSSPAYCAGLPDTTLGALQGDVAVPAAESGRSTRLWRAQWPGLSGSGRGRRPRRRRRSRGPVDAAGNLSCSAASSASTCGGARGDLGELAPVQDRTAATAPITATSAPARRTPGSRPASARSSRCRRRRTSCGSPA
jgi:hypothetical protein